MSDMNLIDEIGRLRNKLYHDPHCRDCRRFEAAKAAMQGFCANNERLESAKSEGFSRNNGEAGSNSMIEVIAEYAVCMADALLAELEKNKGDSDER